MQDQKTNIHTINFTDEDELNYVTNLYIQLLIERDHPEILEKAAELAKKFIEFEHDKPS